MPGVSRCQRSHNDDHACDAHLSPHRRRRLISLLLIAYMIAFLDRINIGYAQLQMKQSLPFDDAVYGLGAGIFFIGYFLFEVPSNLLLEKIGARKTRCVSWCSGV
jgi:MFS family permease